MSKPIRMDISSLAKQFRKLSALQAEQSEVLEEVYRLMIVLSEEDANLATGRKKPEPHEPGNDPVDPADEKLAVGALRKNYVRRRSV